MAEQAQQDKSDELLTVDEIEDLTKPQQEPQQEQPQPESKYGNKTREELEKMLEETQSMVGAQSQEVKRARDEIAALKAADQYIAGQLAKTEPEKPKELDYYGNPEEAIKQTISSDPKLAALEQKVQQQEAERKREKISAAHPDWQQVMDSADFATFVQKDALAKATLDQVTATQNIDLAIELVTRFKNANSKPTQEVRQDAVKAASTGSVSASSDRPAGKKVLASSLRKLMKEDRKRYDSLVRSGAIGTLYEQGRVIED